MSQNEQIDHRTAWERINKSGDAEYMLLKLMEQIEEQTIQRCQPFGGTGIKDLKRLYATPEGGKS